MFEYTMLSFPKGKFRHLISCTDALYTALSIFILCTYTMVLFGNAAYNSAMKLNFIINLTL